MSRHWFVSRPVLMLAAATGFSALLLSSAGQAATDTIYSYSTPRNGYFSIDRMAMMPTDDVGAADFLIETGNGQGLRADNHCFNAAVNLPNGATVVNMAVWYSSSGEGDPQFFLLRQRLSDGLTQVVAMAGPADDSNLRKLVVATPALKFKVIDNERNSYGFRACLSQLDRFYAARLFYTFTEAGD